MNSLIFLRFRNGRAGGIETLLPWQKVTCLCRLQHEGPIEQNQGALTPEHEEEAQCKGQGRTTAMVTSQILPCGLHVVKDLLFLGKLFKMLLLAAKSRSGSCQDAAGASTAISFLDRMQQKKQVKANAAGKTLYRAQLPSSHLEQQDQLTCCHLPLTASTLHHPPHSLSPGAHREVAVPFGQGS